MSLKGSLRNKQRAWVRKFIAANQTLSPLEIVEGLFSGQLCHGVEPPDGWGDPWLLGVVHEQSVSSENRESRGAWYTPKAVVTGLAKLAFKQFDGTPEMVMDPTCGGGAFLLAALDEMLSQGVSPVEAANRVHGMDIDEVAVAVCKLSVRQWCKKYGVKPLNIDNQILHGDALNDAPGSWNCKRLVLGNPPFASPLHSGAINNSSIEFRNSNADLLGSYADLAAMHLLNAVQLSKPGSVIAMVQPVSIFSARDLSKLRNCIDEVSPLSALWIAKQAVFDASVRTCAPVLVKGSKPSGVELASGPNVVPLDKVKYCDWNQLAADALEAPTLGDISGNGTLGSITNATAGFRDEYYGLAEACEEWEGGHKDSPNRLVTVGAIDPLWSYWGEIPIRFANKKWVKPWVNPKKFSSKTKGWVERQQTQKILLATQAKVLEPFIDYEKNAISVTPLILIEPFNSQEIEKIAAVLLAPPVVLWAWRKWFGSALSIEAIKLSAKQVLELPLPSDVSTWDEAAGLLADAKNSNGMLAGSASEALDLAVKVAGLMNHAYKADSDIYHWWLSRL